MAIAVCLLALKDRCVALDSNRLAAHHRISVGKAGCLACRFKPVALANAVRLTR
jgi:hypothetical protein